MKIFRSAPLFLLGCYLSSCVTPEPSKVSIKDENPPASLNQNGFMAIAGPNGVAQAEYEIKIDFANRIGQWMLKPIADVDGMLEGGDSSLQLFGGKIASGEHVFADVEGFPDSKDRDPIVQVTSKNGQLTDIKFGDWPTFLSNSRDGLKKIQRLSGQYSISQDGEEFTVKYSLVLNWQTDVGQGAYFQAHFETEGRVPEEVLIADKWSFNSQALKIESGKCAGCKIVKIQRPQNEENTPSIDDFVVIELSADRKIKSITSEGKLAKLGK